MRPAHVDTFASKGCKIAATLHASITGMVSRRAMTKVTCGEAINPTLLLQERANLLMEFNRMEFFLSLQTSVLNAFSNQFLPVDAVVDNEILPNRKMMDWIT
jgi:hypothetical protein